ncbi:hypothetical protein DV735_g4131, partial [Chaetothyriales sp. CBS 134920]
MIFSTLLREWGVPKICVQEVLELEGLFEGRAESIYGLILLSRWTASEKDNELDEAPTGVWFANQVQSFSCATVSLMNIIMNHPELDLGEDLNAFRSLTQPMNSLERGWELDGNDKIRNIHNSFGTDIDKAKMDGMEKLPRKLGDISTGDSWISPVLAEVMDMREKAAVNQFEVSLLSLVQRLDDSEIGAEAEQMEQAREDWGPFLTTLLKLHGQRGDLKQIMEGS